MVRLAAVAIMIAGGVFVFVSRASAATEVGGLFFSDETWTEAQSPYIVKEFNSQNGVGMAGGATLTIEPGVVVKFEVRAQLLTGTGKLVANGTAEKPIVFTALSDDSAGGDTNGDGAATAPTKGDWGRISLGNDQDQVSFAEIRYANTCLGISFASPVVKNSTLRDCEVGIDAGRVSAAAVIENNQIYKNTRGLRFLVSGGAVFRNNNIYDNTALIFGAENIFPEQVVDGRNNWWGHASGPFHPSLNPAGLGNRVSDGILFDPWLGQKVAPPAARNPVIIVPGIVGTDLFYNSELIWLDLARMLTSPSDEFIDALLMDNEGRSINNIFAGDIVRKIEAIITYDYSGGLIQELHAAGYIENKDLFVFPYDWRQGIKDIALDLQDFIRANFGQDKKVDIIAHSMGGSVAKQYILDNGASKIDKLIFVGTPHLGAPKSAKVLIFGDPLGIPFLNPGEIKKISRNMSSLNQLLPNQDYFSNVGGYLKTGANSLNYQDTKTTFANLDLNEFLINQAEAFYLSGINNLDLSGVKAFNINGCNTGTLGEFKVDLIFPRLPTNIKYVVGDGTVPLASSSFANVPAENTYYVKKIKHATMMTEEHIRKLIVGIFTGTPYNHETITKDKTQCKLKGKTLGIFSPVEVKIFDQNGNYAGPNNSGGIDENIPGLTYEVFGDEKFVFLPTDEGQIYDLVLEATSGGQFDFKITDIDGSETGGILYNDINLTPNSEANLEISQSSNNSSLPLDYLGDGNITDIPAAAILNAQESQDDTPPVTEVSIGSLKGLDDWWRSDVHVSFQATDDNSGVLQTEYAINGGDWQIYNGPLPVFSEGTTTIEYFSTDRAGNEELTKNKLIKIDKTAPEVGVEFDPAAKQLKFSGIDNLGGSVLVVNPQSGTKLTDPAGNETELSSKQKGNKNSIQAEFLEMKYNGDSSGFDLNRLFYNWSVNKQGTFNHLVQLLILSKNNSIFLQYQGHFDQTEIRKKVNGKIIKETKPGLVILKIKTNERKIEYEY